MEVDENTRALNRQEWLQCLVRIAIMRYVIPKIRDVSRALEALFKDDIEANLTGGALQDNRAPIAIVTRRWSIVC